MHPWQSGRLHRTHNAASKERRWFKPNWMQIYYKVSETPKKQRLCFLNKIKKRVSNFINMNLDFIKI